MPTEALPAPGGSTELPKAWPRQGQRGPSPGRAGVPWAGAPWAGAPEATRAHLDTNLSNKPVSTTQGLRGLRIVHQGLSCASLSAHWVLESLSPCLSAHLGAGLSLCLHICLQGSLLSSHSRTKFITAPPHQPKLSEKGPQTPLTTSTT